ncbi:uncharacterized protein At5g49945-like [Mercurialis annua]|uniref:uncharacterized protein At5g49945-like n=1 Tax=Mercurialis annua TaxID=3986 RepID=UPI002160CA07|nr:uncharacterized protein At5g49945-like [Mercurialis annua]
MTRPVFLLLFLLLLVISPSLTTSDSHFEGFEPEDDDVVEEEELINPDSFKRTDLPLTTSSSDPVPENLDSNPNPNQDSSNSDSDIPKPTTSTSTASAFDYWDEDEFEGVPVHQPPPEIQKVVESAAVDGNQSADLKSTEILPKKQSYVIEIVCVSFLICFIINYFTGKKENENLALSWASKFATKDSIFEKNFSLLGVGDGDDSPLLLKEGQNVFKFYASGRRYCQGLLATMELKSRHDLISRLYNMIVPCKDEISFEVYMNDEAMDQVVFAIAKKKAAKSMQKEVRDLQKFAGVVAQHPGGRKWVSEELAVISESKEVAGDLITEAVLEQVFGEKAFEKYGKGFISMHFSDQHPGTHRKMLLFKFALPNANNMADMTRLVALVPYYIDLVGRYKLSSQARSKTDSTRVKAAQEAHKELQNVRQEALQRKKAERRKMLEEAEAKLGAEAIRKKEAKERARQMKKAMPKMKMTRAH